LKSSFDELLRNFCRADCDRFSFLSAFLTWKKIPFELVNEGGRHILVRPEGGRRAMEGHYNKILTAHYDRVEGSPGANDNAAAVFILLRHLETLNSADYPHNTALLFTDNEELTGCRSIRDQGAYQLGQVWRERFGRKDLFFVLDMCGIGDTLIWGITGSKLSHGKEGENPLPGPAGRTDFLYRSLQDLLFRYSRREDMGINSLFSDDLGFLLNGLPALQLSVLPWKEAQAWKKRIRPEPRPAFRAALADCSPGEARISPDRDSLPPSWQVNHTCRDEVATLRDGAFRMMDKFLRDLSRYQIPLPL